MREMSKKKYTNVNTLKEKETNSESKGSIKKRNFNTLSKKGPGKKKEKYLTK
jgi:hypothetical protein